MVFLTMIFARERLVQNGEFRTASATDWAAD